MKARLHFGKRLRQMLAFLLVGIIVSGRLCAGLTAVYASDQSEDALFSIDGLNLLNAFGDAEVSEEVFDYASLDLKAENSSVEEKYEELLNHVYLLDKDLLEINKDSAPGGTALDVFYDSEEGRVIFLYENKSELTVTFNTNVAGHRTNPVTVKPNTDRLDEENAARGVNYADEDEEDSENAKWGGISSVSSPEDELQNPEGDPVDVAPEAVNAEEALVEADGGVSSEPEEKEQTENVKDAQEEPENEVTEIQKEAQAEAQNADPEKSNEKAQTVTQAEVSEVTSKETPETTQEEKPGEVPVTIQGETSEAEQGESQEKTQTPEVTSGENLEETSEVTQNENEGEPTGESESTKSETPGESSTENSMESTTAVSTEESVASDSNAEKQDEDDSEEDSAGKTQSFVEDFKEEDVQVIEDDSEESLGTLEGIEYDTVTIGDHINAKALVVAMNDLSFLSDLLKEYQQNMALFAMEDSAVSIGDTGYETFAAALADAKDGDTITLLNNISENITIDGIELTIDLNDHTWTADGASALTLNNATMIINGGSGKEGKFITATSGTRAIKATGGSLTINDVYFDGSGVGGAIDAQLPADDADSGMTVSVNNCTFSSHNSSSDGGAVYLKNQSTDTNSSLDVKFNGCTFDSNIAATKGGAVLLDTAGGILKPTFTDCKFTNNKATNGMGGAICFLVAQTLTIKSSTFTGNTAKTNGGAVLAKILDLSNGSMNNNTAGYMGGAVLINGATLDETQKSTINGTVFNGNTANGTGTTGGGGAIYSSAVTTEISDVTVEENQARSKGGGIAIASTNTGSSVTISGTIQNNNVIANSVASNDDDTPVGKATSYGGGIYVQANTVDLSGATITANTAARYGGGVYLETKTSEGTYKLSTSTHIYNNVCKYLFAGDGDSSDMLIKGSVTYKLLVVDAETPDKTTAATVMTYTKGSASYVLTKTSTAIANTTATPNTCVGYYTDESGVYLQPSTSHTHASNCYSTLEEAYNYAIKNDIGQINICSAVTISPDDEKYINDPNITFVRCKNNISDYLMKVDNGEVVMKDTKIDGNNITSKKSLIYVGENGTLTISDNTLIQNGRTKGNGGAIYVYGGILRMTGGTISGNSAIVGNSSYTGSYDSGCGGAIYIDQYQNSAKGSAEFDGGILSGNSCTNFGGAICAQRSTIDFGTDDNGGTTIVTENKCGTSGSGICYGTSSTGNIYRAEFTNNNSDWFSDTVSGAISIVDGASVQMKNAYVTNNTGTGYGKYGALYSCPTSKLAVFQLDGALIVDNPKASDIHYEGKPLCFVSDTALGGGEITYYNYLKTDKPEMKQSEYQYTSNYFSMTASVSEKTKELARDRAQVIITGNTGKGPGYAISNNGTLIIGTDTKKLRVKKEWQDKDGNLLEEYPENVKVYLAADGDKLSLDTRYDAEMTLNEDNDWSYTWDNLGDQIEWTVLEDKVSGFYDPDISDPEAVTVSGDEDEFSKMLLSSLYETTIINKVNPTTYRNNPEPTTPASTEPEPTTAPHSGGGPSSHDDPTETQPKETETGAPTVPETSESVPESSGSVQEVTETETPDKPVYPDLPEVPVTPEGTPDIPTGTEVVIYDVNNPEVPVYSGPYDPDKMNLPPGDYEIVMLNAEGVPLASGIFTINEDGIPLSKLPETGDTSIPFVLLALLLAGSAAGMIILIRRIRQSEE